jgi:hypothetical protein
LVSQNEKEFVYNELNIYRQTMPSSEVTWNLFHPSPSPSSLEFTYMLMCKGSIFLSILEVASSLIFLSLLTHPSIQHFVTFKYVPDSCLVPPLLRILPR